MKNFKVAPQTAKRVKAIVAAAMAITLAVPTTAYLSSKTSKVEAEEAGLQALTTVTFEKGFEGESVTHGLEIVKSESVLIFEELMDETGSYIYEGNAIVYGVTDKPSVENNGYKYNGVGNQPTIGGDDEKGNVFVLDDTVVIDEFKKKEASGSAELDAATQIGDVLQAATIAESQAQINNPFAGKDLSKGATVSYWVKVPADKNDATKGVNSSIIVFGLEYMDNHHKVTTNTAPEEKEVEKAEEAKLSIQLTANNDFHYVQNDTVVAFDGDGKVMAAPNTWAYITVSMTDTEVSTYVNGEVTKTEKVDAAGLTAALSDANTDVFFGGNYSTAAEKAGQKIGTVNGVKFDDVSFYDKAVTAEEAAQLYNTANTAKNTVPTPVVIESFDFENGMTGANGTVMSGVATNGADTAKETYTPQVVSDAQKGNVLRLGNGTATKTSAVVLSANPFGGKDLVGATVNFWVKGTINSKTKTVSPSVSVSFIESPTVKTHGKISATCINQESQAVLYAKTDMDAAFYDGWSTETYKSLKNNFMFSTKKNTHIDPEKDAAGNYVDPLYDEEAVKLQEEYTNRVATMSNWHMVTVVFTNAGIKMYLDGQQLSNNLAEPEGRPTIFGPRFYDGYYQMIYDGYAEFHRASGNQGATPLMTMLTRETTNAHFGYLLKAGSNNSYDRTYETFYDDITYYASALTSEQINSIYNGEDPVPSTPDDTTGTTTTPDSSAPTAGSTTQAGVQTDASGNLVANANGVVIEAAAGVLPEGTELLLGSLGTVSDAEAYSTFKNVLAGIQDFSVKDFIIYTVTASDATVKPNGTYKLTLDIPAGFDASALVVVDENGKQYAATVSADGKTVTVDGVDHFGKFSLGMKDMSTDDESTIAPKNAYSGKTGDTANVVIPVVVLAAAMAAFVVASKKNKIEE